MIENGGGHSVAAVTGVGVAALLNHAAEPWTAGHQEGEAAAGLGTGGGQRGQLTLHHLLTALDLSGSSAVIAGPAGVVLDNVLRHLAQLHSSAPSAERLAPETRARRRGLVDRVYGCLIDSLPEEIRYQAREFVEAYVDQDREVVHGGICAGNIWLPATPMSEIRLAASEGHVGDGTYDLACLVADYLVPVVRLGASPAAMLNLIWHRYRRLRLVRPIGDERSFRIHLALQLMRRLLGFEPAPGRLQRADLVRGRVFYMDELTRWLR